MKIHLLIILLVCIILVNCHPGGAPEGACDDLTPAHDEHQPKSGKAPYSITANKKIVSGGQTINVKISGIGNNGKTFKGFMMVARDSASNNIIGKFTPINNAKLLNCGQVGDSITHTNDTAKSSLTFKWTAPKDYKGKMIYSATIVKEFDQFWTNVKSSPITVQ